jgi:VanZ family protein
MMERHYATVVRLLAWISVIAIAILSLVPVAFRPHTGAPKYSEHFVAYLVTSALFVLAYKSVRRAPAIVIGLVVYAGSLEFAQLWVPGRMARIGDFAAGALGVVVGILLIHGFQRFFRRSR